LAVAALPVASHLAPRVADERAVIDEDGRQDRAVLRDVRVQDVARGARGRLQQVLRGVVLGHRGRLRLYLRRRAAEPRMSASRKGSCAPCTGTLRYACTATARPARGCSRAARTPREGPGPR